MVLLMGPAANPQTRVRNYTNSVGFSFHHWEHSDMAFIIYYLTPAFFFLLVSDLKVIAVILSNRQPRHGQWFLFIIFRKYNITAKRLRLYSQ